MAILDNQNLGKLAECAQYQAQLQKNLMYLAAIADAQPQAPAMPSPMAPHPAMQQGGYFMQNPQAAATAMVQQQPGIFTPKLPLQFNNPHQIQDHQQQLQLQQHHQAIQMGMRPSAPNNNSMPTSMHSEVALGGGVSGVPPQTTGLNDVRGGSSSSKQDADQASTVGSDGHGISAAGHGAGVHDDMKGSDNTK